MRRKLHLAFLLFAVCSPLSVSFAFQVKGGRIVVAPAPPPKPKVANPTTTRTGSRHVRSTSPQAAPRATIKAPLKTPSLLADLTINANPPESSISLNGREYSERDQNGNLRFNGLKTGEYTIIVRKETYRETVRKITLEPKENEFVSITLDPLPGVLRVSPSVNGTKITVSSMETGNVIGDYAEAVNDLEVLPGRYRVLVSKDGYRPVEREVTVRPAESVYLEPPLEALPVSKPRIQGDSAMSIETLKDGKHLIVSLTGKSGDPAATLGAVNVMLTANGNFFNVGNVTGLLPGFPCQVDFVRIENVAEYSFKEAPGTGNRWSRVVVRVRPKDSKRPVHFSVIWKALQSP